MSELTNHTGKEGKPFSTSAYRVLFILLLLNQHRSLTLLELNLLLLDNEIIQRTYNSETITKYVNTLRAAGCSIPSANRNTGFQYILTKSPLPYALEGESLDCLANLKAFAQQVPTLEVTVKEQLLALTNKLLWGLQTEQRRQLQEKLAKVQQAQNSQASIKVPELIEELRQYCQDKHQLSVDYLATAYPTDKRFHQYLTIEPLQVQWQENQAVLDCIDTVKQVKLQLNVERILSVQQLPTQSSGRVRLLHVVFQLTGRLAKSYRPYPNEEILRSEDEATLMVRCQCDNPQQLLVRLLRYGAHCSIVSPHGLRQQAKQLLLNKLNWLQAPEEAFKKLTRDTLTEANDTVIDFRHQG